LRYVQPSTVTRAIFLGQRKPERAETNRKEPYQNPTNVRQCRKFQRRNTDTRCPVAENSLRIISSAAQTDPPKSDLLAVQILDGYESTVHSEPVLTFRAARITDHNPVSFSR
jgi:hypothetical protein